MRFRRRSRPTATSSRTCTRRRLRPERGITRVASRLTAKQAGRTVTELPQLERAQGAETTPRRSPGRRVVHDCRRVRAPRAIAARDGNTCPSTRRRSAAVASRIAGAPWPARRTCRRRQRRTGHCAGMGSSGPGARQGGHLGSWLFVTAPERKMAEPRRAPPPEIPHRLNDCLRPAWPSWLRRFRRAPPSPPHVRRARW